MNIPSDPVRWAGIRRSSLIAVLTGVLAALMAALLCHTWLLRHYELRTFDYFHRFKLHKESISNDIIIVQVDDTTVERLGWPLPREHYARIIKFLRLSGARVIALDMVFSDPGSSSKGDEMLAAETGRSKSVIHAAIFGKARPGSISEDPLAIKKLSLPYEDQEHESPVANQVLLPIPRILEETDKLADISIEPEEDGVVRRVLLVRRHEKELYPSLSLAAASTFLGVRNEDISIVPGRMIALTDGNGNAIRIPIDLSGRMLINYANPDSFKERECSFLWLLQKFGQMGEGEVPDDMPDLEGKLVLIGSGVTGDTDQKPTPFASSFPMVRAHASVISSILQQRFLRQTPGYLTPVLSMLFGLLAASTAYFLRPIISVIVFALIVVLYVVLSYSILMNYNLWNPILQPCLAAFASFAAATFYRYVSDKRRMIISLDELSRYNESIMKSMTDGLLVVDAEGTITRLNRSAGVILGLKEDVLGRNYQEVLFGDGQILLELITRTLARQTSFSNKEVLIGKDDNTHSLEVSNSLLRNEAGENAGAIFVMRDVSRLRELQRQMQFRERLSAIGALAGEVSHEIKNSLQGIRLYAEFIMEELKAGDPRLQYAKEIIDESTNLGTQVIRLNEYAKPIELSPVKANMNELVESAALFALDEISRSDIEVIKRFQEDLPEIPVDTTYMRQAIVNLIVNAVHAMPDGGSLTLGTRSRNESLEVIVADTGIGIPEHIRGHIFDPYFTTKKGSGTGLGLSIVYKNVEAHGGTVQLVEVEVGKGSTFVISLPVEGWEG